MAGVKGVGVINPTRTCRAVVCCARAASGQDAAAPPISFMTSRRFICAREGHTSCKA